MKTQKISRWRSTETRQLDNGAIAELLAREAEQSSGHVRQAFRRAARKALLWKEEVCDLLAAEKPLVQLDGIGPFLADRIMDWVKNPPPLVSAPPIRAEFLTLVQARRLLTQNPDWRKELKGVFHTHTVWSDGSGTVMQMGLAAKNCGYQYISITDHTKGLKIANGLDEARLVQQSKDIDIANATLSENADFSVLKSAEVNLSPAGQADMDSGTLSELDLVIGSFHSALRRTQDQTSRYVAALGNRNIHILGHTQTRIFNHREGLNADWTKVFAEAARRDKAIEINGYPDRQDLKLSLLRLALKEGTRISLGTDAHRPWQLAFVDFALAAALLTGFQRDRIVNFMSAQELLRWARQVSEVQ